MAIIKTQPHSVVTHWLYLVDFHVELANLQHFLALAMASHFGGRRVDAEEFSRQRVDAAIGVGQLKQSGFLVELDVSRGHVRAFK